ncbi:beta strand repeat-containing protein, partial [Amantichitinum ursilacus]|uniref:beta strand repeat-containing protein n=1 Tax=Amantichitinum ursilacus TaxID=857265 RepID=UPI0006B59D7E
MKQTSRRTSRHTLRRFALRAISNALLAAFSGHALALTTLPSATTNQTVNSDNDYQVLAGTTIVVSGNAVVVNGIAPFTFSNAGAISASGGSTSGLLINAAGTVTNQSTGTIIGATQGVSMQSANANLVNYGDISARFSHAVLYGPSATGTFDNYGTLNGSSSVGGSADALWDQSTGLFTFNNHVGASARSGAGPNYAPGFQQSAGTSIIQNDGVITAFNEGVYLSAGITQLTNSATGSISSTNRSAVSVVSGSQINNSGTISTSGSGSAVILLRGSNNSVTLGSGSMLVSTSGINILSQGTGNTLMLTGTNTQAGNFTSDTAANGLTSLISTAGSNWTLTGDITLAGTAVDSLDVQGNLTLGGAVTQTNGGGVTIAGGGMLTLADGGSGGTLHASIVNNGTINFNRSIALGLQTVINGSGDLIQSGSGTLVLLNPQDYTGATTVAAGTMALNALNAISSSSGVQVAAGAALDLTNKAQLVNNLSGGGSVALGLGTLTDNVSVNGSFDGVISGTGGLIKTGSRTLILTGDNTLTGQTNILQGTLQLGAGGTSGSVAGNIRNGGTLAINRSDAFVLEGTLTGTGTLNQNGSGTTTLTRAAGAGAVNVNNGTLVFGQSGVFSGASLNVATGGHAVLGSAGQLALSDALDLQGTLTVGTNYTLPLVTADSATLGASSILDISGFAASSPAKASELSNDRIVVLQTTNGISGNFGVVNFNGATANHDYLVARGELSSDSKSYSVGTALAWTAGDPSGYGTFTLPDATDAFEVDVALANQSANANTGWDGQTLTKGGAGTLTLSVVNSYTGATQINAGTLTTGVANSIASSSAVNVASGASFNLNGFNQSAQALTGSGNVTLGNATLSINNGAADEFGGVISGAGGLSKAGAGTLLLSGNNTYSGQTTVSAGTLQIGNGGTSGSVAGAINNAATLALNRSDAYTLAGALSGTGVFNQNGSGTTTLAQAGSQGAVNVNAGGLTFGQTGVFNATSLNVATGATATIGGAAVLNATGAVNIDGTLGVSVSTGAPLVTAATATLGANSVLNVAGFAADTSNKASDLGDSRTTVLQTTGGISGDFASVNLGGASAGGDYLVVEGAKSTDNNSYSVGTTLAWTSNGASANGSFTLTQPTDAFEVDVVLANQAANPNTGWDGQTLTKAGAGTLTLSALNSYSGATVVNAGELQLAMADSILQSSAVTVAAGATVALGSSNQTFNRL